MDNDKYLQEHFEFLEFMFQFEEGIDWYETKEINEKIKTLSTGYVKYLRELLIEVEEFHELVQLDKVLGK